MKWTLIALLYLLCEGLTSEALPRELQEENYDILTATGWPEARRALCPTEGGQPAIMIHQFTASIESIRAISNF